jgi:hypothetical protein
MRLYEAAIACRAYGAFGGGFDDSLQAFIAQTDGAPDLESGGCGPHLMKWLNDWGCRQFAKEHHRDALERLRAWAHRHADDLPGYTTSILRLTEAEIRGTARAYDELKEIEASQRRTIHGTHGVRVGATGAAKILYALRPNTLPPWDDAIRERLKCDGSAESYNRFLRLVMDEIQELLADAARHGVSSEQLPSAIGRGVSTLPKIVDEYFWVTITRNFTIPKPLELQTWASWCSGS